MPSRTVASQYELPFEAFDPNTPAYKQSFYRYVEMYDWGEEEVLRIQQMAQDPNTYGRILAHSFQRMLNYYDEMEEHMCDYVVEHGETMRRAMAENEESIARTEHSEEHQQPLDNSNDEEIAIEEQNGGRGGEEPMEEESAAYESPSSPDIIELYNEEEPVNEGKDGRPDQKERSPSVFVERIALPNPNLPPPPKKQFKREIREDKQRSSSPEVVFLEEVAGQKEGRAVNGPSGKRSSSACVSRPVDRQVQPTPQKQRKADSRANRAKQNERGSTAKSSSTSTSVTRPITPHTLPPAVPPERRADQIRADNGPSGRSLSRSISRSTGSVLPEYGVSQENRIEGIQPSEQYAPPPPFSIPPPPPPFQIPPPPPPFQIPPPPPPFQIPPPPPAFQPFNLTGSSVASSSNPYYSFNLDSPAVSSMMSQPFMNYTTNQQHNSSFTGMSQSDTLANVRSLYYSPSLAGPSSFRTHTTPSQESTPNQKLVELIVRINRIKESCFHDLGRLVQPLPYPFSDRSPVSSEIFSRECERVAKEVASIELRLDCNDVPCDDDFRRRNMEVGKDIDELSGPGCKTVKYFLEELRKAQAKEKKNGEERRERDAKRSSNSERSRDSGARDAERRRRNDSSQSSSSWRRREGRDRRESGETSSSRRHESSGRKSHAAVEWCAFCRVDSTHDSVNCSVYSTYKARMERSEKLDLCLHCLKRFNSDCKAPDHAKDCKSCGKHKSHIALCKGLLYRNSSETN